MDAVEHLKAAEKALIGAKDLMRKADEVSGENKMIQKADIQMSASLLLSVANVHANLAGVRFEMNTKTSVTIADY